MYRRSDLGMSLHFLARVPRNTLDHAQSPHSILSAREFQVFCELASGETVSRIAEHLSLSVKTVSTYRVRLMQKMDFKSNTEMANYALDNGLIQCGSSEVD